MSKFTVGITTYVVIEADDLDAAYRDGEGVVRSAVALSQIHGYEDQVIDVELTSVNEIGEE